MGREIRRVPADWDHPKKEQYDPRTRRVVEQYQPMFNKSFMQAAREWMDKAVAWDNGTDPNKAEYPFFWQWDGMPPDPEYYRPDWPNESMTHYQVYETVSEGTPVTPHFATKEELIDYLVEHGDEWDQQRGHGGWSRANAEAFVKREWASSLTITKNGQILTARDQGDM